MTSVEKVAEGVARAWRHLANRSDAMARKVEKAVRAAEIAEQPEYREAARLYRTGGAR